MQNEIQIVGQFCNFILNEPESAENCQKLENTLIQLGDHIKDIIKLGNGHNFTDTSFAGAAAIKNKFVFLNLILKLAPQQLYQQMAKSLVYYEVDPDSPSHNLKVTKQIRQNNICRIASVLEIMLCKRIPSFVEVIIHHPIFKENIFNHYSKLLDLRKSARFQYKSFALGSLDSDEFIILSILNEVINNLEKDDRVKELIKIIEIIPFESVETIINIFIKQEEKRQHNNKLKQVKQSIFEQKDILNDVLYTLSISQLQPLTQTSLTANQPYGIDLENDKINAAIEEFEEEISANFNSHTLAVKENKGGKEPQR